MKIENLRSLLERVPAIRAACDLDLLLFFHRHPYALLTSEQLVAYLGYDRDRMAKSLDGLIEADLLTRSQNPAHAARLYVLKLRGLPGGLLESLLRFAATRQGRRVVLGILKDGPELSPPIATAQHQTSIAKVP